MKKHLLILIVFVLGSCTQSKNEMIEATLILRKGDVGYFYENNLGYFVTKTSQSFQEGDVFQIEYRGSIRESFPAQMDQPIAMTKIRYGEHRILLVKRIILDELNYKQHFKLNPFDVFLDIQGISFTPYG